MAKTKMNEAVDTFFKKYTLENITESTVKSNLPLNSVNDYGNILHAVMNYDYPTESVKKTIKILLDLGVNPNHQSKVTGMTFIHLSLYGYTNNKGQDISYSENFITDMIDLAKSHGFDVNIKDSDDENIAVAAIASEVYRGSILAIINALGKEFEIDESLKHDFDEYLQESKNIPAWNKRLLNEKDAIYQLVERANLSLEDIEKEISFKSDTLVNLTSDLTFETLSNTYKDISSIIKELIDLLKKREVFEVSDEDIKIKIDGVVTTINNTLTSELDSIKLNPSSSRISRVKPILKEFVLEELLEILSSIESDYNAYQESLRESASGVKTINEVNIFLEGIKGNEIEDELTNIVKDIMDKLNELINSLKSALKEDKEAYDLISSFTNEEYEEEVVNYEDITESELTEEITKVKDKRESYRSYIYTYLDGKFRELTSSISPLLESGVLNNEDVEKCLQKCLTIKKQGVNESHDKKC